MRRSWRIVIVGPNALAREGLAHILHGTAFRVVASNPILDDGAIGPLPHDLPLLLVLDAGYATDVTLRQIRSFREQRADGRVAVISDHYRPDEVCCALRNGAHAYLVNMADGSALIKSLELVMLGATILPPQFVSDLIERDRGPRLLEAPSPQPAVACFPAHRNGRKTHLSQREECILRHLVGGESNKAIARKNKISEATVKVHIKGILRKIGVHNRTQAAIWAMNNGALHPDNREEADGRDVLAPAERRHFDCVSEGTGIVQRN